MQVVTDNQAVLTLAFLGLIAVLMLVLLLRRPGRDPALVEELSRTGARLAAAEEQLRAAESQREALRGQLEGERVACGRLETERESLKARLAAVEEELRAESERLHDTQRDLTALKQAETRLTGQRETLQGECEKLVRSYETLEERLRAETNTLKTRDDEIGSLKGEIRGLTETLRAEREKHVALVEETEKNRDQFVAQFKAISGEILQNQGKAATEAQKTELEKIIVPFKAEIEGLKTNLRDISDKAEKERQGLGTQLLLMQAKAAELAEEANGLARALRGEKKKQGNWGETILERILEAAGLQEGTHFTRQAQARDEDGARLIPDVVVHLPGERDVVIDSKVTLVAYQDLVQADEPDAEAAAMKRHVQSVRAHMRSLSDKRYDGLGYGSVDSVMMFLPVEGALTAALSSDPDLVLEAAERRVHLMTPATLMPALKIVEHLWTIDTRNRSVDDIVDRAGRLHDKFVSVVESVQKIGEHLKKASDCQDEAIKRMSDGPGNVIRQVDQLRQLGARARKALPADLLAASDDGEAPDEAEPDETADTPEPRTVPALTGT